MSMKIGNLVRFNHEKDGGPVHRVVSVMADGMIEIHDMGGYFAPHLFVIADDIAAIPPDIENRRTDCKYGDPTCPCQDGDECHYEGPKPINVPPEYVRNALSAAEQRAVAAERRAEEAEKFAVAAAEQAADWAALCNKEGHRAVEAERRAERLARENKDLRVKEKGWADGYEQGYAKAGDNYLPTSVRRLELLQAAEADRDRLRDAATAFRDAFREWAAGGGDAVWMECGELREELFDALSASPAPSAAAVVRAAVEWSRSKMRDWPAADENLRQAVKAYTADPGGEKEKP